MSTHPHADRTAPAPSHRREMLRLAAIPVALLIAAALAACGGDKSAPTDPGTATGASDAATTAQISTDVAADAGDATATLNDTYASSEAASGSVSALAPSYGLSFDAAPSTSCSGPDASGFYTCTRTQENNFTVVRSYRYWSRGSFALHYAEASTDSVNHRWMLGGVRADTTAGTVRTRHAMQADTSTMVVVRGSTPQHVWSGYGVRNDTTTASDANGPHSYVVTAHDTAAAVAFATPRKSNPYPLSGSVTHSVQTVWTGPKGGTVTTTRRAVVTFNGTQIATVQVGGLTCSLDLKTHHTSGCK